MDSNKPIWEYFARVNAFSAKCNQCRATIKTLGGSTSGLHAHLKCMHNVSALKRKLKTCATASEENPDESAIILKPSTSGNITSYFQPSEHNTLQATVSRMVAKDGIPFLKFCTSEDLRKLLRHKFQTPIPTSPNTISKMVADFSAQMRINVVQAISSMKKAGKRFSLSFDEWTSLRNRRYININLHYFNKSAGFYNLGMVRVMGSLPAEACVESVNKKLFEFGLSLQNDIVCISTDGARVMQKIGRIIPAHQILCILHGIQLAVVDVLYKKPTHTDVDDSDTDELSANLLDNYDSDDDNLDSSGSLEVIKKI